MAVGRLLASWAFGSVILGSASADSLTNSTMVAIRTPIRSMNRYITILLLTPTPKKKRTSSTPKKRQIRAIDRSECECIDWSEASWCGGPHLRSLIHPFGFFYSLRFVYGNISKFLLSGQSKAQSLAFLCPHFFTLMASGPPSPIRQSHIVSEILQDQSHYWSVAFRPSGVLCILMATAFLCSLYSFSCPYMQC